MSELLATEYELIVGIYEGFNEQFLILKGWSVSIGIAALIAAYSVPLGSVGRIGVLIATVSAVPFWLLETTWRTHQKAYLERITQIEECASGIKTDCVPLQAFSAWNTSYWETPTSTWLATSIQLSTLFPHVVLLVGGVALLVFLPPGKK